MKANKNTVFTQTMLTQTIGRREILKRGAVLGGALLLPNSFQAVAATPLTSRAAEAGIMRFRGVTYDVGTAYEVYEGPLSRTVWRPELLRRDMKAIREGLRCNVVTLYGTDIARLTEAAEVAFEHGLEVWLQPRLMGANERDRLEHLAEATGAAETLRQYGSVTVNIGVELSLFMTGIIPGKTFYEKAATLSQSRREDILAYKEKLDAHLEQAVTLTRSLFSGPLTYSAGEWEPIDWKPFDIIGHTFYRNADNAATYPQMLQEMKAQAQGKPVVITEFGSCTFEGAGDVGGMGWDIIDYSKAVPEIPDQFVRSERDQADTIAELLGLYEDAGLAGAFIYDFSTPANPYNSDPKYDLDMASYGLVKPILRDNEREATHWEPKEAFERVAENYERLEQQRDDEK